MGLHAWKVVFIMIRFEDCDSIYPRPIFVSLGPEICAPLRPAVQQQTWDGPAAAGMKEEGQLAIP